MNTGMLSFRSIRENTVTTHTFLKRSCAEGVHADSFLHSVASPFHSSVATCTEGRHPTLATCYSRGCAHAVHSPGLTLLPDDTPRVLLRWAGSVHLA